MTEKSRPLGDAALSVWHKEPGSSDHREVDVLDVDKLGACVELASNADELALVRLGMLSVVEPQDLPGSVAENELLPMAEDGSLKHPGLGSGRTLALLRLRGQIGVGAHERASPCQSAQNYKRGSGCKKEQIALDQPHGQTSPVVFVMAGPRTGLPPRGDKFADVDGIENVRRVGKKMLGRDEKMNAA